MVTFIHAQSKDELGTARELLKEYAATVGFDLCFQDFEKELAELPGEYRPPDGCLLLAQSRTQIAGCVALKKISEDICEMKRLYVKKEFRGQGIGKALAVSIIDKARKIGYARVRLDTVPLMKEAITPYRSLGFKEIDPYRQNPIKGAIFMELVLR